MKNKNNVHPLLHALLPVGITLLYILIGFTFDSGWAVGWILFLLIPIIETLINAINTKDASKFAYPVFLAAIFLFTGMMWGWWHPMWAVFITIPAYYAIADYFKNPKAQNQQETAQDVNAEVSQSTYYQPSVNVQPHQKSGLSKKSIVAIIITSVIAFAVVACVAIVSVFSWLSGSFNASDRSNMYHKDVGAIVDNCEFPVTDFESIEINWVNGNVDIGYYNGDSVIVLESNATEKNKMSCSINNQELVIDEFDGKKFWTNIKRKDLSIQIPNDFDLNELELNIVSANANINDLSASSVDFETVSGNINATFKVQPNFVDCESVSGNMNITLPKNTTGYSINKETVSGTVRTENMNFGNGSTKIDLESVSGDYTVSVKK